MNDTVFAQAAGCHYLSTYCLHGHHAGEPEECRGACKFCDEPCRCPCHEGQTLVVDPFRMPHEGACAQASTGVCSCSRDHFILQAIRFQQLWADEARENRGIRKALNNLLVNIDGRADFHALASDYGPKIEDDIIAEVIRSILANPTAALDG